MVSHDAKGNGSTLFRVCHCHFEKYNNNKFKMAMRQSIFILLFALLLSACSNKDATPQQWEYTIVSFPGSKLPTVYSPNDKEALIELSNSQPLNFPEASAIPNSLNLYGKDGWELVSAYTTVETVFPNFGDASYHTGMKDNTRTNTINFVFKRIKQKGK